MKQIEAVKFINYIKNFPPEDIIKSLSIMSSHMNYYDKDTIIDVRKGTTPETKKIGMLNVSAYGPYSLSATDINSIAFYSICKSHDYRVPKKNLDFFKLVHYFRVYHSANAIEFLQEFQDNFDLAEAFNEAFLRNNLRKEKREKWSNIIAGWNTEKIKKIKDIIFAYSITYTQFLYQDKSWIRDSFNRNYFLLNEFLPNLLKKEGTNKLDKLRKEGLKEIVYEKFNMTVDELSFLLIFLCSLPSLVVQSDAPPNILETFEGVNKIEHIVSPQIETFSAINLKKVLDYYAVDYEGIKGKENKDNETVFYSKPFIKTPNGNYYAVNAYLALMVVSNSLFWIMRDYYGNKYGNDFPTAFGFLFEYYIKELAQYYCPGKYQELKRNQTNKTCDFRFEFDDIILLVEAKATLMPLSGKTQNVHNGSIKKAIEQYAMLISAYEQFPFYEQKEDSDKIIKIILLYENVLNPTIVEEVIDVFIGKDMPRIVSIGDFEKLLVSWSIDKKNCKKMLEELLSDYKISFSSALFNHGFHDKRHFSEYGKGTDYFGNMLESWDIATSRE